MCSYHNIMFNKYSILGGITYCKHPNNSGCQQRLSTDESIRAHMTTHQHSSLVDALLCTCTCTVIWESFVDKIFLQHKIQVVQKLSSRKLGGEGVWG